MIRRIDAFPIKLPPLRERIEDLPELIESLLAQVSSKRDMTVDAEALKCLKEYHFPGNVRELRNILEHAVLLADDDTIGPEHLPDECRCESTNGKLSAPGSLDEIIPLNQLEGRYIQKVLAHYHGDRKSLAEKLGISERTLYRKLEALRGEALEIENLS